ncbi:MAG: DUF3089 domain-containing protein [Halieaceae bacterium]|jgi:hypothetical protein|nr:DUF3089 domain-containing protein [Halieaceae bacterium]
MRVFALLLSATLLSACSDGNNNGNAAKEINDPNPYEGYTSELYGGQENWLCRPDIEDEFNVCQRDLSTTIVFADGTTQLEQSPTEDDSQVDCFYVYPTVSGDVTDNSDLVADAEIAVTYIQAARYRSACRMFAPLYRQITVAALFAGKYGDPEVSGVAYADVLDAFKYYVANAGGRGFILIGHSQGSTHLIRLIQEEIEVDPYLASRMVAAHLIGMGVALPNDADVGASFETTPPCTFDKETNCFVNYTSFRETAPPVPGEALFGVTDSPDTRAACTHPVDLGAGRLELDAIFAPTQLPPYTAPALNQTISTPFVKLPGLFEGECIEEEGKGYLAITINGNPDDPRVDDVEDFLPGWGLHLIDMGLAQGDLVRLARKQVGAWLEK